MKLKVSVFEYLNQKVMYIQDVNYYFRIRDNFDIKLGDYELSEEEVLNIAKENDPEEYEVFINTSIEERLNKIKTYDIEEIKEQSSYGQFTLCLHPSRKCNLNCKYCFRESEYLGEQQLTFEVAKDAIDFLVDKYAPCASKYVVDLSGSGEPLLQIDLVKQIVDYCKQKRNEICKNIEVMFCTNLTLLTPEIVEYLDNEPAIILGTSIDGDRITNDNNRVYANGKGTYNDIVKGLKMFKNKKLGLAVTITPLNQDVDLIYDCLYHLPNVDCVSMKFIRCYDGSKYDFENFDVKYLISRYEKLCKKVLDELERKNFNYLLKLINGADILGNIIAQNLLRGIDIIYKCDAGKNRITVDSKGYIYSCSVMMGNNDFIIGNIYKDVDNKLQRKYWSLSKEININCANCSVKHACGGECYANSYLKYNDMYTSVDKNCKINIELNKISYAFIEYIKFNINSIYNDFINSIFKVQDYSSTDSAIWAIMTYLKLEGLNPDYGTISNKLDISDLGVNPQNIVEYLRTYNLDVDAYVVDFKMNGENLKFPLISLINKKDTSKFTYLVIAERNENYILFKSIENSSNDFIKILLKDYINDYSDIVIF